MGHTAFKSERVESSLSVAHWLTFWPKSSKEARENNGWPEEFVAEFRSNFIKSGRKGAEKSYIRKFTIDPSAEHSIDVFVKNGRFFSNIGLAFLMY